MRFPGCLPLARTRLSVESLEDRSTPALLSDPLGSSPLEVVDAAADRVNVVMATPVTTPVDQARLAEAPFAATVEPLGFGIYRVTLAAGTTPDAAARYYGEQPGVVSAAPDEIIRLSRVPNDTSYGSLWAMPKISAPTAWDTSVGSGNFVVAVIDTGVDYTHPDLAANMWRNPGETAGDGTDNDGNGLVDDVFGAEFVGTNSGNPMDDNNHGTHVAGTIGAVGNNARGVAGVNWNVRIMALKFLGASGSGSTSDAIEALNYAVAEGAKISNNSWGGGGFSSALSAAIGRARDAGHIFVAAAGNSSRNIDTNPSYPASYEATLGNVVVVASTTSTDARSSFSNWGPQTVLLAAPGSGILSTTRNNTYGTFSGTSMASPHVAGALALFWDRHPDWTYQQVIARLATAVDPVPALAGLVATGGRLNLAKLLQVTSPPPPAAPGPVVAASAFTGSVAGTADRARVTFAAPINPATFDAADVVSFTGPGGAITTAYTVAPVVGSNDTQFDISFAAQAAPGTYTLVIGPDVRDAAGNPMNQNANATAGENPADRYTATGLLVAPTSQTFAAADPPLPILDNQTTRSAIVINQDLQITDVNVQLTLTHTYDADLVIRLVGPGGQTVVLSNRRGGSGDNFSGTVFNDEARVAIESGQAPFFKSFRPDQSLTAFDNRNARGTWTLEVADVAGFDVGELTAWSLTITGTPGNGWFAVTASGFPDEPAEPVVTTPPAAGDADPVPPATAVTPAANPAAVSLFLSPDGGAPVLAAPTPSPAPARAEPAAGVIDTPTPASGREEAVAGRLYPAPTPEGDEEEWDAAPVVVG
jgi:subtilisin family serine protease